MGTAKVGVGVGSSTTDAGLSFLPTVELAGSADSVAQRANDGSAATSET